MANQTINKAMVEQACASIRATFGTYLSANGVKWWVVSLDGCAELGTGLLVDRSGTASTIDKALAAAHAVVREVATRRVDQR